MVKKLDYIYGIHTVLSYLEHAPHQITRLLLLESRDDKRIQEVIAQAERHNIPIDFLSRKELDAHAAHGNHQGAIACVTQTRTFTEEDLDSLLDNLDEPAFLLILDEVQDPHNLGACLRTANAVGIHAVIAPKDRACSLTPLVRKVASGAAEATPFIQVTNIVRTIEKLKEKNIWVYGFSDEAKKDYFEIDFSGAVALVLGAEGSGLRRLTSERCDELVMIPMLGSVSSLNVSVACGAAAYEVVRQRNC